MNDDLFEAPKNQNHLKDKQARNRKGLTTAEGLFLMTKLDHGLVSLYLFSDTRK